MNMSESVFLGLEIGGTKLQLALGRADGKILARERRTICPDRGASAILAQIEEAYRTLIGRGMGHPATAGIGFGGPVDANRGVVLESHQVEGWNHFPLVEWARQTLGLARVALQNDADTAGLGEVRQGGGRGLSPVFYVTIGSGIGGGLIIDGQIYRGSGIGAGEIGHLWVDLTGASPKRLETIASGWSIGEAGRHAFDAGDHQGIMEQLADNNREKVDAPLVAIAASMGDHRAMTILNIATRAMGQALAHVATLLAPRRIILGGGVSLLSEDLWARPIFQELEARSFPPFRGTFDLTTAALGEEVVLHGALALASDLEAADLNKIRTVRLTALSHPATF